MYFVADYIWRINKTILQMVHQLDGIESIVLLPEKQSRLVNSIVGNH